MAIRQINGECFSDYSELKQSFKDMEDIIATINEFQIDSDHFKTAALILFGIYTQHIGTINAATDSKYSKEFLRPRVNRLRKLKIWFGKKHSRGYVIRADWLGYFMKDPETFDNNEKLFSKAIINFILDVLYVNGDIECRFINKDDSNEKIYNLPKPKLAAAVELGHRGGSKGGKARAAKLSSIERSEIAKNAAKIRWNH